DPRLRHHGSKTDRQMIASTRRLPSRPDAQPLKRQAKELLRAAHMVASPAVSDFRQYHPEQIDPVRAKLSDAQLVLARSYQFPSWPRLVAACQLIDSLAREDFDAVRELLNDHPSLLPQNGDSRNSGWEAVLADAANLGLRRVVTMLSARGGRGVSAIQARPELRPWLDTLRMLGRIGARPTPGALRGAGA